ncbi:hypothetical protein GYMLUDRAFT_247543 [Collybiopsis luxurians FD-317 M1]|uniref:Uncharacterized protein n=1 Tax=Collybiopsis luxurians FD-317 M1 TaxID=944289 RepID=A0A0D0CNB9_9AGAR|nr:hypothetical protein GYMLUDRAFT_247543 [Collybiopsis luxurians FD-317 M1]
MNQTQILNSMVPWADWYKEVNAQTGKKIALSGAERCRRYREFFHPKHRTTPLPVYGRRGCPHGLPGGSATALIDRSGSSNHTDAADSNMAVLKDSLSTLVTASDSPPPLANVSTTLPTLEEFHNIQRNLAHLHTLAETLKGELTCPACLEMVFEPYVHGNLWACFLLQMYHANAGEVREEEQAHPLPFMLRIDFRTTSPVLSHEETNSRNRGR